MMIRRVLLVLMLVSAATTATAQSGTAAEQDACRPDVRRFCYKVDPNAGPDAFLACLENHRDSLSAKCLAVLIDHGR